MNWQKKIKNMACNPVIIIVTFSNILIGIGTVCDARLHSILQKSAGLDRLLAAQIATASNYIIT